MCTRRQLGLAALVLALVALLAAPFAVGKKAPTEERYARCVLAPTDVEPHASGSALLYREPWIPGEVRGHVLSVTARHLTPGEAYSVVYADLSGTWTLGSGYTNNKGSLNVTDSAMILGWGIVAVSVVNADGEPVLEGSFALG